MNLTSQLCRPEYYDVHSLRQRVFQTLRAWSGYANCARVMARFPELSVYLAGGVVRNAILERAAASKDFDLFLGGESVAEAIDAWTDNGRMEQGPFNAPRWFSAATGEPYCDLIRISRFSNGLGKCADIGDVLAQVDFTGNAVAFDLRSGQFLDPQNGVRDLRRGVLRASRFDYPDEPFLEGRSLSHRAIFWFRLVHYASSLGLEIEARTRRWLVRHQHYRRQREQFAATFFEPNLNAAG